MLDPYAEHIRNDYGTLQTGNSLAICMAAAVWLVSAAAVAQPVIDTDFPDPFILSQPDGSLIAYATNTIRDGQLIHVQVARSADGRSWSPPAEAMPQPPPWANPAQPDVWAPEVIRIGRRWVLYFSARHRSTTRSDGLTLCVGAAVATAPEGPFVPQPEPVSCGEGYGVIDPSPMRDRLGRLWLYSKTDGNCCNGPTWFFAQHLARDGLSATGKPVVIPGLTNNRAWEGNVIEAPQMHRHGSRYVMFFSGNDYTGGSYATGYADCAAPTGPCADGAENPILATGEGLTGPGHQSVFRWAGRDWIAFHGWRGAEKGRYRAMYIRALDWVADRPVPGTPLLPPPPPTTDAEPAATGAGTPP
jgi:beta-xylosidase